MKTSTSSQILNQPAGKMAYDAASIHHRDATLADVPAINRLVNSAYRGDESKVGWTTEADLLGGQRSDEQMIADLILAPNGKILLFFLGHQPTPVGCVYLALKDHEFSKDNRPASYFGMFTTAPFLQGKGLGHQFLQIAENECRQKWSSQKMWMTVITLRLELIAWYERRGYIKTSNIVDFPVDERFGIPQVANLQLQVFEKDLAISRN